MNHKYKDNTPVKNGDLIELTCDGEVWHTGKVKDALASQFTVVVNKKLRFFFYADKGLTWRRTDD